MEMIYLLLCLFSLLAASLFSCKSKEKKGTKITIGAETEKPKKSTLQKVKEQVSGKEEEEEGGGSLKLTAKKENEGGDD